ncbi:MAG: hypothetical protein OXU20_39310 [Myxococcales bacterium]|nr:hypothetical protein [Myxococcales bacterium]
MGTQRFVPVVLGAALVMLAAACSAESGSRTRPSAGSSESSLPETPGEGRPGGMLDFDNAGPSGAPPAVTPSPGSMRRDPAQQGPGPGPMATAVTSGVEPATIDQCTGTMDPADIEALAAGGVQDDAMAFLYPYDGTVFPRGLPGPWLQWSPAGQQPVEAVFVHARSRHYEYRGCFAATPEARVQFPTDAWDRAFVANEGPSDPLRVEITTRAGGVVSGPIAVELTLARATLKGAIYYNTYGSLKASLQGVLNGVVMRIQPGASEPEVFVSAQTPSIAGDVCVGCHSVSADGTRMVVEEHSGLGLTYNTSLAYDLGPDQAPRPPVASQLGNSKAGFSAVYPDGSRFLTTGRSEIGPFSSGMSVTGTFGIEPAALWNAETGQEIPDSGIPPYAKMPMFNRSGTQVVFTDQDAADALVVMDFDPAQNRFSDHRVIAQDARFIGWPFFLPDDSGVVFAVTDAPGYTTVAGPDLTGLVPNAGHLMMVDLESGDLIPLARAMGYRDRGMTDAYLPYGERDLNKDYIPTVSPVAAGGYYWMFFTSKRAFGNTKAEPIPTPDSKQIWVSALSIPGGDARFDASMGQDPSHPAFHLPGQELESGNIRAFATLNPCKADGESCETGIDCCGGFCTDGVCGTPPPDEPPRCSQIDEACTTVADCCDADSDEVACIAGFCAYLPPPPQ